MQRLDDRSCMNQEIHVLFLQGVKGEVPLVYLADQTSSPKGAGLRALRDR